MHSYKLIIFICLVAVSYAMRPRIIGGEPAWIGEVPYIVSLQWIFNWARVGTHICGGTIIHERWILTASHCTEILSEQHEGISYTVVAGKLNIHAIEETEQRVLIESHYQHFDYVGSDFIGTNDIALIKLAAPLRWTDYVMPITLPVKDSDPRGEALVSGWGAIAHEDDSFDMPSLLNTKILPIIEREECNQAVEAVAREDDNDLRDTIKETDICTGQAEGGYSVCNGDSGGPLTILDDDENVVLVGIATWALLPCGRKGAPSVYVRVSSFIDWIQDTMAAH